MDLKEDNLKSYLTQNECAIIPRNGYVGFRNPCVYLKPLNNVWDILMGDYYVRNTVIVDTSKDKHVCNDEGNYIITKGYICDDVNETYLLDQLWLC